MKNILLLFLFLSCNVFAQSVRLDIDSDVYAGAGTLHEMVLEVGSEEGGTPSNAHLVFVPMRDDDVLDGAENASNVNFTILSPVTSLPWFKEIEVFNPSLVRQRITVTPGDKNLYLWAGVYRSESDDVVVLNPSAPIRAIPASNGIITYTLDVKIHGICTSSVFDCDALTYDSDDQSKVLIEPIIYFFLSTEEDDYLSVSPKISEIEGGVFFKYLLSNAVDLGADLAVLENLIKGDGRLKVEYGGEKIVQMADVIGIVYDASPTGDEWPQQSLAAAVAAGGRINADENGIEIPGEFFVKDLTNYREYWVGVAFVNKWGFATKISETRNQTPEKIEAFLEEKACYLVSAGFKKEHYVLDYFRDFRDQILLKNEWGKRFVTFYYNTAPKYAQIIWHNDFLSQMVRVFAYIAYFLMRYFPAMALVFLAGLIIRKLWPYYR
ncbi:MAG: hypothetical protein DRQ88_10235 [Epsilonproteobacteria bacterium]|nr:MAG: hypothetical protein DRQ89_02965 [Campylobacterota bacterium]RLA64858.1 MAG: hypothetical protein DRQ88_10235 [Campylobacterota bacterium]